MHQIIDLHFGLIQPTLAAPPRIQIILRLQQPIPQFLVMRKRELAPDVLQKVFPVPIPIPLHT